MFPRNEEPLLSVILLIRALPGPIKQSVLAYYGDLAWRAPDPKVAADARRKHRLWEWLFALTE